MWRKLEAHLGEDVAPEKLIAALTIALAKIWLDGPLVLGLQTTQIVLLLLSAIVAVLTVVPGRSKPLQGGLHLVLLATFVFVSIKP